MDEKKLQGVIAQEVLLRQDLDGANSNVCFPCYNIYRYLESNMYKCINHEAESQRKNATEFQNIHNENQFNNKSLSSNNKETVSNISAHKHFSYQVDTSNLRALLNKDDATLSDLNNL